MMMDVTTMSAGMIVAMGIYRPAIFIFALFGIAAIAALSASAVAQNPQAPINTLTDLEAALLAGRLRSFRAMSQGVCSRSSTKVMVKP